jgi:hypothetical protein
MKHLIIILAFSGLCSILAQNTNADKNKKNYTEFIKVIKPDMGYKDLVTHFGKPDKNIGSGVDIYVYNLGDSSKVMVGYSDKILYVEHIDKDKKTLERTEMNKNKLTYEYFKENLKKEMKYSDIVNTFGAPHKNIGSGIDMYEYVLEDKTKIVIGYAADKILYARHKDKKNKVLHVLYE